MDGETLGQRLMRGPLQISECVALLQQIADALAVAHHKGVIHRDLKPTNLFLIDGDCARVKLLDFGIARKIMPSHAMTRTGMVVGTRILISWGKLCNERGDRASAAQHFRHAKERVTEQLLPYARDEMQRQIEVGLLEAGTVPESREPDAL